MEALFCSSLPLEDLQTEISERLPENGAATESEEFLFDLPFLFRCLWSSTG